MEERHQQQLKLLRQRTVAFMKARGNDPQRPHHVERRTSSHQAEVCDLEGVRRAPLQIGEALRGTKNGFVVADKKIAYRASHADHERDHIDADHREGPDVARIPLLVRADLTRDQLGKMKPGRHRQNCRPPKGALQHDQCLQILGVKR